MRKVAGLAMTGCTALSFLLLACGPPIAKAPAEEDAAVRIMSFNIRFDNPADGANAWPLRKEMAKDRFRLLESSTFWLSEEPETPGLIGWDAACARVVTRVRPPIDHIFVGPNIEVTRAGILPGSWDGRFVSDHNPVLAELVLARR